MPAPGVRVKAAPLHSFPPFPALPLVRLAVAIGLAANFAVGPAYQVLGKVERSNERASTLTRTGE
jgi:hypothetical protein